jgi:HK97 family phage major capsid protein
MSKLLVERKNELITRAEDVLALAKTENRELTDAEAQELAEIRDDVKAIKEKLEIEDDIRDMLDGEVKEETEPKEEEKEMATEETRAIDEERMFEEYIRGTLNERSNDMTKGDNGAVIPQTIANKIIKRVYDISPVLDRSSKYNIKGTLTIPYYDESVTHITVDYQTEFEEMASNSGKFTSSVTLTGFLAGALVKVSRSLINNSQFNIVDHVVDLMAEAIARWIDKELLVGTNDAITGLKTLTNSVTSASASAITADDVVKLHDKVKDVYQRDAIWVMSPATRTALRLLKDEMGRYLLQDDISSPFGTSLLGKPVYVSDQMEDIATGKTVIYYGDFKGLATKFSENISIEVLRERFATQHAVGVVAWFEMDAKVEDAQKIAKLVMA